MKKFFYKNSFEKARRIISIILCVTFSVELFLINSFIIAKNESAGLDSFEAMEKTSPYFPFLFLFGVATISLSILLCVGCISIKKYRNGTLALKVSDDSLTIYTGINRVNIGFEDVINVFIDYHYGNRQSNQVVQKNGILRIDSKGGNYFIPYVDGIEVCAYIHDKLDVFKKRPLVATKDKPSITKESLFEKEASNEEEKSIIDELDEMFYGKNKDEDSKE